MSWLCEKISTEVHPHLPHLLTISLLPLFPPTASLLTDDLLLRISVLQVMLRVISFFVVFCLSFVSSPISNTLIHLLSPTCSLLFSLSHLIFLHLTFTPPQRRRFSLRFDVCIHVCKIVCVFLSSYIPLCFSLSLSLSLSLSRSLSSLLASLSLSCVCVQSLWVGLEMCSASGHQILITLSLSRSLFLALSLSGPPPPHTHEIKILLKKNLNWGNRSLSRERKRVTWCSMSSETAGE